MLDLQVVKRVMYYISVIAFGTLRLAPEEVICINNTPAAKALYAGVAELWQTHRT